MRLRKRRRVKKEEVEEKKKNPWVEKGNGDG